MNKPATPATLWTMPLADDTPVPGYEAWLEQELTQGLADLDAGRSTPLEELRREFGHE